MTEENKCNGLDCAICAETKCPNEKPIINGIDVSECEHLDEWKHCNICKELIKTIPDRHQCLTEQDLRCEYYFNCHYKQLKRLQEENKELKKRCEDCEFNWYPDFTAEKQLQITKFLLKKAVYYDVKDDKYWFFWEDCESAGYKPFDEAIAHFVNKIWQDLTDQEKEEIRGILNE